MLPFSFNPRPGIPIYEQIVTAVKRARVRNQLRADDPFPSVRELSQELRINPNTAQKVLTVLVNEKLVEVRPGIGSIVTSAPVRAEAKMELILGQELELLIIEAMTFGVSEEEFLAAVRRHWLSLRGEEDK